MNNDGFKVEISSAFERLWCYNMAVTCGCFDADGNRIDFVAAEDTVAPVGAGLTARPQGYEIPHTLRFETAPCDHLLMYIYLIPHTLPAERDIADTEPFDLHLRITRGRETVTDRIFSINRWSGASIELRVPKAEK